MPRRCTRRSGASTSRTCLGASWRMPTTSADVNSDVLARSACGRLRQRRPAAPADAAGGSYDLVTLEPPPIAYAGVAALYSREFYALARSRLKPGGYVSQWLPAYQVPSRTTLAMIRAFIDVFPQAVLISGAEADLLLLGANDSRIEIDPARVAAALVACAGGRGRPAAARPRKRARDRRHVRRLGAHAARGDPRRDRDERRPSDAGIRRAVAAEPGRGRAGIGRRLESGRVVVPAVLRRWRARSHRRRARHVSRAARSAPTTRRHPRWRAYGVSPARSRA